MDTLQTPVLPLHSRRFLKGILAVRNAVVLVAVVVIALAAGPMDLDLPRLPMAAIIGFLIISGLTRRRRLAKPELPGQSQVFLEMVTDTLVLTALFYFTGGATNPFVWFFLFPAIISALLLSKSHARSMAALAVICYSFLLFFYQPIHERGMPHPNTGFETHILGMWFGFVMSAGFVAFIVAGLAERLRKHDRVLNEAREQALRDENMISLGTLAAGAAHDLGTPLGTLAILSTELQDDPVVKKHPDLADKLSLMREQVNRCKETLSLFSSNAGAARAESGKAVSVRGYLQALMDEWKDMNPDTDLDLRITGRFDSAWLFVEPTLTQALHNLMDNAADASFERITVKSGWSETLLTIKIIDTGPGISPEIVQDPGRKMLSTKKSGMGVGLYLATSTIQRLGGKLVLSNLPEGGAMAHVTLPVFCSEPGGR
jgi:two-component system sensor histidine kinase RegB